MLRLAREVPTIVGAQGRRRRPGRRRPRLVAEAPAGFELYSGDDVTDPAPAGGRRGRRRSAWPRTGSARRSAEMVDAFVAGDLATARRRQRRAARLLRLRVDRRATPTRCRPRRRCRALGPAGRPVPPAHGRGHPRARRPGADDPGRRRARRPRRHRCPRWAGRMPEPVRIVFLGGLGEIGRNCACIEVDGRIVVLDCGIMFPDAGHARHRPGAARLHLPARPNADRGRRRSSSPTATRTTPAAWPSCSATCRCPIYGSALTLGPGPQPGRGGRPGRPDPASSRWPTASAAGSGPVDVEFIPVTHSVPARLRHRLPHARRA